MDGTKRAIRQEMRRRRRALSPGQVGAAGAAVARFAADLPILRAATVVLAYAATDNEIPTDALIAAAWAGGARVFLPRLSGARMTFAEHRPGAGLRPGAHAIPEPLGDPIEERDVAAAIALVPLLAWDDSGGRVGRGGGHYDRALAGTARPACLIGLGYAFQQCPRLPRDPWDLRLDYVVTEGGVVRCWNGDGPSPSRKEDTQPDGLSVDGAGQPRAGRRPGLAGGLPPTPAS